ncbi:hypothetical protein B0H14DRAFT_3112519 [Mycena olivaceomarginata]|nr:hypothetical protein B0H14DRAFT_3112519 [Mycena olivaceomarginata]
MSLVNVAQTYIACTTTILVWDWLSCLPQEWRYIWKSRAGWSPIKILYCLVRYYTLMFAVSDVWLFAHWSESSCARYVRVLPGIALLTDLSVELVLALRVYALYGCSKRIGAFLSVLIAGFLGVMIAVSILAFDYTRLPSWPGPCIAIHRGPKFIIAFYASPMVFDIIMTALTVYKVMDHNRRGVSFSLMNRMVRDGIFYFLAITSLNLLNVIFFIQPNKRIQAINAPTSIQISSVLCCRLILNLRMANEAQGNVRRYSHTRGRWDPETMHFAAQLRNEISSPGTPNSEVPPPTENGILVHFEHQARSNQKDAEGSSVVILSSV